MLTGMMEPTSGDAVINGWSIKSGINKIRESLGYCPQFDVLFDFMTVKEHLEFYATMKSTLASSVISMDVEE